MQVWHVSFPEQQAYISDASALAVQLAGTRYTPEPSLFFSLFPFHLLIDQDMRLVQVCISQCVCVWGGGDAVHPRRVPTGSGANMPPLSPTCSEASAPSPP